MIKNFVQMTKVGLLFHARFHSIGIRVCVWAPLRRFKLVAATVSHCRKVDKLDFYARCLQ